MSSLYLSPFIRPPPPQVSLIEDRLLAAQSAARAKSGDLFALQVRPSYTLSRPLSSPYLAPFQPPI